MVQRRDGARATLEGLAILDYSLGVLTKRVHLGRSCRLGPQGRPQDWILPIYRWARSGRFTAQRETI